MISSLYSLVLRQPQNRAKKVQLENVAIANALQLQAARRRAVPIRFNVVARANLNLLSLSVAVLEGFYCLYVTLRCDLEL